MIDLKQTVRGHGGRLTEQKKQILNYLCSVTNHPTAEMVFAALKKKIKKLGLATVYRNLNYLADHGLILRLSGSDGKAHFDGNTCFHLHFICDNCGAIQDIFDKKFINPQKMASLGTIRQFDAIIHGQCRQCNKTNNT